jgi:hypothetical protein
MPMISWMVPRDSFFALMLRVTVTVLRLSTFPKISMVAGVKLLLRMTRTSFWVRWWMISARFRWSRRRKSSFAYLLNDDVVDRGM